LASAEVDSRLQCSSLLPAPKHQKSKASANVHILSDAVHLI
jgi:hypothetical protein